MAVKVTVASGLKTTVEVPCVNVPSLVKSVPEVPVRVIVAALAVKVPAEAMLSRPVDKAKFEFKTVSKTEVALVVPVIVVVFPAATIVVAPKFTVRARALEAVGLMLKSPVIFKALVPKV